jgi:hypothetical protein
MRARSGGDLAIPGGVGKIMNRTALVAALVSLVGCSDYGISNKDAGAGAAGPDIEVKPSSLTFGTLSSGETEDQTFTVTNVGTSTLHVTDVKVDTGKDAFSVLGPKQFDLEPEESMDVGVEFTPMGADENFGQILVVSDDGDEPESPVDLLGYGAVPELQIDPQSYIFDTVVPCGDSVDLTLTNVGSEDLVITDAKYESLGLLSLDASNITLPLTLKPGKSKVVTVVFAPTDIGTDSGRLDVYSNDPRGIVSADQNGEGQSGDLQEEQFTEPGVPPVDVMVLIDHSGSMAGDNTDDVESGMPDFVNELQAVADWQLVEVTKEDGCANGGIIDSSTPNAADLLINHAWDSNAFEPKYLTEALLELASVALDQTGPGECNEGFLRPGALLHIITISDEKEQSGQPYTTWLADYESYLPSPDFLKVSAVADINKNCGDGSGAKGYEDAALATGGSTLNICNATWGASFSDIASDVLAGVRAYNLSQPAIPSTIMVKVNGTPTTDFSYVDAGYTVTINSPAIGEGDVVDITYNAAGTCN